MEECMKKVTVSEFCLEDGRKGQSFSGFDVNCLKGAQIPFFKTHTVEGDKSNSNDLRGKINVINSWFKACKPIEGEK